MKKKFAAALIAVMMAGSVMAGCGEKPAEPTPVTVTKEEPKAEAPASVSRETAEKYILGITDRFVLEGAKDIDFLSRKEILDKVIAKVEADDSAVDTTKPGTYKVRYTVTVNVRNLKKAEAYVEEHPEALEASVKPVTEDARAEGSSQPAGEAQAEIPAEPAEQPSQPADKAEAGSKDAESQTVQPAEDASSAEKEDGRDEAGPGDAGTQADAPAEPAQEPSAGPVLPNIPEEVFDDPASSESGDPAETAEVVIEKEVTVVTPEEAVEIIEGGGEVWTDGSTPATVEDITGGEASQAGTTKPAETVEPVAGADKETSNEQADSRQPGEDDDDEEESSGSGSQSSHSSDSGPSHTHNWVEETETVYHEEKGHCESVKVGTKTVVDEEAWDENVYEDIIICSDCGYETTSTSDIREHIADVHDCEASYGVVSEVVDTIHHPASTHEEDVYEDQWVVDSGAWSETVVTGYYCPECGAHK